MWFTVDLGELAVDGVGKLICFPYLPCGMVTKDPVTILEANEVMNAATTDARFVG